MKGESQLQNQLKSVRTRLGLSQQQVAAAAGVTRQTISGIESGQYAASATVALKLAKTLGCRVEDLFWLDNDLPEINAISAGALVGQPRAATPARTAVARIQGRWLAYPLDGERAFNHGMVPADGVATWPASGKRVTVQLLDEVETLGRTVVIAGCAPALSLWARSAERWHPGIRIHWEHANSTAALHSLASGEAHIAGVHLSDRKSGEDNLPHVRRIVKGRSVTLMNFGVWDEGLVVARGNPKNIMGPADLARPGVSIVNRETGAGARLLLDDTLREAKVPVESVAGYDHTVDSHQAVARAVQTGQADAGISTASIAATYDLAFVPLRQVRYDLAILDEYLEQDAVRQLLSTLEHRWVRSQLRVLGGYDTGQTGAVVGTAGVTK